MPKNALVRCILTNPTVDDERAPMRAAAALVRHAARVQRRTPVAARRWRPQPTSLRRTAIRCLSSKNDNDDDDGGPVAVTIDDDDSDAPASVGVGDGAPTPDRVLALALARRPLFPGMVHSLSLGPTAAAALQAERDAAKDHRPPPRGSSSSSVSVRRKRRLLWSMACAPHLR